VVTKGNHNSGGEVLLVRGRLGLNKGPNLEDRLYQIEWGAGVFNINGRNCFLHILSKKTIVSKVFWTEGNFFEKEIGTQGRTVLLVYCRGCFAWQRSGSIVFGGGVPRRLAIKSTQFGGSTETHLFLTARECLFRQKVEVKGLGRTLERTGLG